MTETLLPLERETDWQAFHAIRRAALFEERGRGATYDPNHPDDRHPDKTPLIYRVDGWAVGVLRLDRLSDGRAAIRLVAIDREWRGLGHGRQMITAALKHLRDEGFAAATVASAPAAAGFYEALGFTRAHEAENMPSGSVRLDIAIA